MYQELVKSPKLRPLQLEIAAARLAKQYRERMCSRYNMPESFMRVDAAIKQVPNKTYCKCTIYYSLHEERFNDAYFWANAGRRILFFGVQVVSRASTDIDFKFNIK